MKTHHVSVVDLIEIRSTTVGVNHAPGLVITFDGRQCLFDLPPLNTEIELLRPDGTTLRARFTETKSHGDGRSFFFPDLTRADAPIGTVASWAIESVGKARRETMAAS